jgi:hypothetical protein
MISYTVFMLVIHMCFIELVEAALPREMPPFQLDFYHIKTPQLIGIIIGCFVFIITVSVVIYLLYASGTLSRAFFELQSNPNSNSDKTSGKAKQNPESLSPYLSQPELYDHLLKARSSLSSALHLSKREGKTQSISSLSLCQISQLFDVVNGSARFHESQYDPLRLWGWSDYSYLPSHQKERSLPWSSVEAFEEYLNSDPTIEHLVIMDNEFKTAIGFISLACNSVRNLCIRIGTDFQIF